MSNLSMKFKQNIIYMIQVILPIMMILFKYSRSQVCPSGEFLYLNSTCESCSSFISNCSVCESGDWSPITNGSFESPEITSGKKSNFESIPGWTQDKSKIELHKAKNAYEGNQYLDTAFKKNQIISQNLTTQPGFYYTLEFAYSPRPGYSQSTQGVDILWNSEIVSSLSEDGEDLSQNSWTYHSLLLQANSSVSILSFHALGPNDAISGLIDAVSYKNLPSCTQCPGNHALINNSCVYFQCPSHCHACSMESSEIICSSCNNGFYVSQGLCFPCSDYCLMCSSDSNCLMCNNNLQIDNGICGCPLYYLIDSIDIVCYYKPLRANFTSIQDYYLINFDEDLKMPLELIDLEILFQPQNTTCQFSIEQNSLSQYKLQILMIPENSTSFTLEISNVEGKSGSELMDDYFLTDLAPPNLNDEETSIEESEDVISSELNEKDVQILFGLDTSLFFILTFSIGLTSSIGISFLSMRPSALWSFLNMSIMIYYLPVQNTQMPDFLTEICKMFNSDLFGLVPNIGEVFSITENSYSEAPENWRKYDINTPSFYLNASSSIITVLSSILFYFVLVILHKCFQKNDCLQKHFQDSYWCFWIRLSLQTYIDVTTTTLLSCSYVIYIQMIVDGIQVENVLSLIVFVIYQSFFFLNLFIVIHYRQNTGSQRSKYGSLFKEFKTDSLKYLFFYPLFYFRRLVYALGMNFLSHYPYQQVALNICLSLVIFLYIVIIRPYKDKSDFVTNMVYEGVLCLDFLLSGLCLGDISETKMILIGRILVLGIVFSVLVNVLVAIISIYYRIRRFKDRKSNKNQNTDNRNASSIREQMYRSPVWKIAPDINLELEHSSIFCHRSGQFTNSRDFTFNRVEFDEGRISVSERAVCEGNYPERSSILMNLSEELGHDVNK